MNRKIANSIYFLLLVLSINQTAQAQFIHSLKKDKKPWTDEPQISCNTYRFIIIGDLTGGEEPGVFDYAVERINELAPDFVISVGDLIDGYTLDTNLINEQWDVFNKSVAKLEAPFFYVPGNHDVGNKVLFDIWKDNFGYDFYTFKIGKTLFIVLNTWEPGISGISANQLETVKKDILNHEVDEPIFVFTHDPFWESAQKEGLDVLDSLLSSREVTFFCGHKHRYLHRFIKGKNHYMLSGIATGNQEAQSVDLGIFHNLMVVSVTPEKTRIANINLKGLLSPSIVNNKNEKQVAVLLRNSWATITPTVVKTSKEQDFSSMLHIRNEGDFPFEITGSFESYKNFLFTPQEITTILAPGERKQIQINLKTEISVFVEKLPEIKFNLNGKFLQKDTKLNIDNSIKWTIHNWKSVGQKDAVKSFYTSDLPAEIEESWDWYGETDGSIQYKVDYDKKFINVHIKTNDDSLVINSNIETIQDKINLYFNPDTTFGNANFFEFEFIPNQEIRILELANQAEGIEANCYHEGNSVLVNLKFPRAKLKNDYFRMNFSFTDSDNRTNLEPSILWWRPRWGKVNDYEQSGVFFIKE